MGDEEKLRVRFQRMAAEDGLVDVKFALCNLDEASVCAVFAEVNAVYAAVDRGEFVPLNFRDSRRSQRQKYTSVHG